MEKALKIENSFFFKNYPHFIVRKEDGNYCVMSPGFVPTNQDFIIASFYEDNDFEVKYSNNWGENEFEVFYQNEKIYEVYPQIIQQ